MKFDPKALLGTLDAARLDAVIETMVIAAAADGELDADEREQLLASLAALTQGADGLSAAKSPDLGAVLDRVLRNLSEQGREARLASVSERLGDAAGRKAAFGLSVEVTATDGIVRTSEREFLLDLAGALHIDRDEAADLVRHITKG
jgi:tellurite resistance protein